MSDDSQASAEVPTNTAKEAALGFLAIGLLAAIVAAVAWFPKWHALRLCDAAIEETLRAPATYHRVDSSGSDGDFHITYDAANGFGVPLRSSGQCFVTGGAARWYEDITPGR